MFRKPMAVAASDLRVVPKGHGEAELRFRQRWASRSFQDVGEKVLVVQLTDAGLRIGREEMLSSEVQRLRPLFEGATEEASGKELYRQVESLMTKAKEGEPERTWIQVVTTMDYGCRCPDYVFSVFSGGADVESPYVYPLFPEGRPTSHDHGFPSYMASYDLFGHFTGESITGEEWLRRRGVDPTTVAHREELDEYWQVPAPVFQVDDWCVDLDGEALQDEYYGKSARAAVEAAVTCK